MCAMEPGHTPATEELDKAPSCLVTMVHGTFAREATWAKEDSTFAKGLSDAYGGPVKCRSFTWSAKNLHAVRVRAATELYADIGKANSKFGNVPHFLVAHSHGGNIAAYCLRDSSSEPPISGVITLGTPFLTYKPRRVESVFEYLHSALLFIGCPFVLWAFLMFVGLGAILGLFIVHNSVDGTGTIVFPTLGAIAGLVLYLKLVGTLFTKASQRSTEKVNIAKQRQENLLRECAFLDEIQIPWFTIRVTGDEAYIALLLLADRLSQFPFRLFNRLHSNVTNNYFLFWAGLLFSGALLFVIWTVRTRGVCPAEPTPRRRTRPV